MTRRRLTLFAAAACVIATSACSGDGAATAGRPTETTGPATTAPAPAAADSGCPAFRGSTADRSSSGPVAAGLLVDAVAGGVGCLDRIEFTFRSLGDGTPEGAGLAPGYTVEYVDGNQFMDGNVAISLDGAAFLKVTIKPASSYEPQPNPNGTRKPTYLGNMQLRWTEFHHLQVVRRLEDVDDTIDWVISLDAKRPFVVDAARNPTRITIWIG